jgi:hypothetical protein
LTALPLSLVLIASVSGPLRAEETAGHAAPHAQMIDSTDVAAITALANELGSATLAADDGGAPHMTGSLDGVTYELFFLPCSPAESDCVELNFYAGFGGVKPPLDVLNEWNRNHRFGRAYLDRDLDAVVEMDWQLKGPTTPEALREGLQLWSRTLAVFAAGIGATP